MFRLGCMTIFAAFVASSTAIAQQPAPSLLSSARVHNLGKTLDYPEKRIAADWSKTLAAQRTQIGRFGQIKVVVDNPPLPMGPFPPGALVKSCTVIIVAGNPDEREEWARSARWTYGRNVYVFNDALSVKDVAGRLASFPPGSVKTLILGGHSGPSGGIFMGIDRPQSGRFHHGRAYFEPLGCESINAPNLEKHPDELATIRRSLSAVATVQFNSCCVGDGFDRLFQLSRAFDAAVIGCTDPVQEWGETDHGLWYRVDKPK
jgi:hypothetical protein